MTGEMARLNAAADSLDIARHALELAQGQLQHGGAMPEQLLAVQRLLEGVRRVEFEVQDRRARLTGGQR